MKIAKGKSSQPAVKHIYSAVFRFHRIMPCYNYKKCVFCKDSISAYKPCDNMGCATCIRYSDFGAIMLIILYMSNGGHAEINICLI